MRIQRTLHVALALTTALAAACASAGRGQPAPGYNSIVQWDSGPLNLDYQRQRGEMDTRHAQEIANAVVSWPATIKNCML